MKLFGNSHHPGHDGLHRPEGSDGAYTPETDPFDEVPPMPETGLSQDTVTFVPEQMKSDSAEKAALIPHIVMIFLSSASILISLDTPFPMLPPSCIAAPSRPADPPKR